MISKIEAKKHKNVEGIKTIEGDLFIDITIYRDMGMKNRSVHSFSLNYIEAVKLKILLEENIAGDDK